VTPLVKTSEVETVIENRVAR